MDTLSTSIGPSTCDQEEVAELTASLIGVLQQELRQNQRLLRVIHARKAAVARGALYELDSFLRSEKEILADCVTFERERTSILRALSETIRGTSAGMRLAELIGYSWPEHRDELLELREEFRDVAEELEALSGVETRFARHSAGRIRLYLPESEVSKFTEAGEVVPLRTNGSAAVSQPKES